MTFTNKPHPDGGVENPIQRGRAAFGRLLLAHLGYRIGSHGDLEVEDEGLVRKRLGGQPLLFQRNQRPPHAGGAGARRTGIAKSKTKGWFGKGSGGSLFSSSGTTASSTRGISRRKRWPSPGSSPPSGSEATLFCRGPFTRSG